MDVTFTVDSASTTYLAQNVEVERIWLGKRRELANRSNVIFTDGYHLRFTVQGQVIEIETGAKAVRSLQLDLEDPSKDVKVTVDGNQYDVVSTMTNSTLYALTYGSRSDSDIVECITKNKVNRTELEKYDK